MCSESDVLCAVHSLFRIQGDEESVDDENHLVRFLVVPLSSLLHNYHLWSDDVVTDVATWLREQ